MKFKTNHLPHIAGITALLTWGGLAQCEGTPEPVRVGVIPTFGMAAKSSNHLIEGKLIDLLERVFTTPTAEPSSLLILPHNYIKNLTQKIFRLHLGHYQYQTQSTPEGLKFSQYMN